MKNIRFSDIKTILEIKLYPITRRRKPDSIMQSVKVMEGHKAVAVFGQVLAVMLDEVFKESINTFYMVRNSWFFVLLGP